MKQNGVVLKACPWCSPPYLNCSYLILNQFIASKINILWEKSLKAHKHYVVL